MTGKSRFERLLEPYHIGSVRTKNRIFKTSAETHYATNDNYVSESMKSYYEALARGGVGVIVVERCMVNYLSSGERPCSLSLDDEKYIPGLRELTKIIHKYNCPAFIQLGHIGPWQRSAPGFQPVAASPMTRSELPPPEPPIPQFEIPRGLAIEEIKEFVYRFTVLAERAAKAGFDGVEINAAASHFFNSFLSRAWNKRQDAYGCQSLENRTRFLVEVIQAIKKRLGQEFPVTSIINGAEYGINKGTTIEEGQGIAKILEAAGVDALQIRGYGYGDDNIKLWAEQTFFPEAPKPLPKGLDWSHKGAGAAAPVAAAIKKVVSIPVITVGREDPVLGEKILREGKADFIAMNRRLIADPELPNKIMSGRLEDIAPCTACLHCCSSVFTAKTLVCRVNSSLGNEKDYTIKPAEKKKKVVVVGGGPAGMEAARVAAMRGHDVVLYEKELVLGGLTPIAALVKGSEVEDLPALIKYLKTQITRLGVEIRLGKEFKPSMLSEIKPDVVILASGGVTDNWDIPGINRKNVIILSHLDKVLKPLIRIFGSNLVRELTKLYMPGGKEVIVIGSTYYGCELAEFLIKRGKKVTIVDASTPDALGKGIPTIKWIYLLPWMKKKGVTIMMEVKYEAITDKGLVVITKEGQRQTIEADTIMPSTILLSNVELLKALEGKVSEVYAIGDCNEPRLIIDAIADGYRIAKAI
jgi:2,4-dienoyl-CoA reductase (NADPH2)